VALSINDFALREIIFMIQTIYELLESLHQKGVKDIEPFLSIGHNPTIGDMYEGLTKDLTDKTVFKGLNLSVVSGKIKNSKGDLSDEIDCMVVYGEGDRIPYTNKYIYDINNVIAVIEVKKNLYAKDLESAYDNLYSVYKLTNPSDEASIETGMLQKNFRSITNTELPDEINKLPSSKKLIFCSLVIETYNPVRIVWGYNGFATEQSLRDKFVEFLNSNLEKKGYSVTCMPSLIICGNNTLIKTNGLPYLLSCDETGEKDEWIAYASYGKLPLIILLEIIWTKLCQKYDISSNNLFGEDLTFENLSPLLSAYYSEQGWIYQTLNGNFNANLKNNQDIIDWEPTRVNESEFILLNKLCELEQIEITADVIAFYEKDDMKFEEIVNHLCSERLIHVDNNVIKLLTSSLMCCIVPDMGFVAADNENNRFTNWIKKRYNPNRPAKDGLDIK
jgi:hypothetical protein